MTKRKKKLSKPDTSNPIETQPPGRPKEDLTSLPRDWYKYVLALYEEGASDVEVKAQIYRWRGAFSNDLWDRWLKEESEFSETINMGKLLAEAWWQKNGRTNLNDRSFNYVGWYMNMKNRYKWTDRQDVTSKDKPVTAAPLIVSKLKKRNNE